MNGPFDSIVAAVARSANVAEVLIGRGVIAQAGAAYARHLTGPACLMADARGWAAAGPAVEAAFRAAGIAVRAHVIPAVPRPKPTVELARALGAVLAPGETPVAVGSGVMNDVVKYAAFNAGLPYLCVATAASMDGYTSGGAPLSEAGFKKTIPCRPARVVVGDLDVIAAAPPEMTGWGYGDLAGKVPAGGDWIIADALGIEPIDDVAWPMVQDGLAGWLSAPDRIAAGDPAAIEGLFRGLVLVGLAMEAHGSSRPASGADHQVAHLWEMQDLHYRGERVSHGACVSVGAVAVLRLYDWLSRQDLTLIDPVAASAAAPTLEVKAREIAHHLGRDGIGARALDETTAKHQDGADLAARLERLRMVWPDLSARLAAQVWPVDRMVGHLRTARAPADPAEIGLTMADLREAVLRARFLRSRYTVLDLLEETGLLHRAVAEALADTHQAKVAE
jgi:glycerol-1-phosphate dehydrogenase [NAD(P)+]